MMAAVLSRLDWSLGIHFLFPRLFNPLHSVRGAYFSVVNPFIAFSVRVHLKFCNEWKYFREEAFDW